MIIREIKTSDAERFANLTPQIEAESEYMLWEAGERNVQVEQQLKMIESIEQKEIPPYLLLKMITKNWLGS